MAMSPPPGESLRIAIEGEMTIYRAAELKDELLCAVEHAPSIEVALDAVTEIDSAGFQLLALLKRECARAGKRVVFTRHSAPVLRILDLCNTVAAFGDPLVLSGSGAAPDRCARRRRMNLDQAKITSIDESREPLAAPRRSRRSSASSR
jgi:anti-anti-sigma factor